MTNVYLGSEAQFGRRGRVDVISVGKLKGVRTKDQD